MVFDECPFCHRPFAVEQVSKEEIDSNTEDLLRDPPRVSIARFNAVPSPNPTPVDFYTTYKKVYRCKHCGREWAKTETVDKEVDRKIAGTEQASDTDVEKEQELAEEEQYKREYER